MKGRRAPCCSVGLRGASSALTPAPPEHTAGDSQAVTRHARPRGGHRPRLPAGRYCSPSARAGCAASGLRRVPAGPNIPVQRETWDKLRHTKHRASAPGHATNTGELGSLPSLSSPRPVLSPRAPPAPLRSPRAARRCRGQWAAPCPLPAPLGCSSPASRASIPVPAPLGPSWEATEQV